MIERMNESKEGRVSDSYTSVSDCEFDSTNCTRFALIIRNPYRGQNINTVSWSETIWLLEIQWFLNTICLEWLPCSESGDCFIQFFNGTLNLNTNEETNISREFSLHIHQLLFFFILSILSILRLEVNINVTILYGVHPVLFFFGSCC